jgi:hypothetical protein
MSQGTGGKFSDAPTRVPPGQAHAAGCILRRQAGRVEYRVWTICTAQHDYVITLAPQA